MPTRIDGGDASPAWPRGTRVIHQRFHRASAIRECAIDDVPVANQRCFVLLGRQDEEPRDDASRRPTTLPSDTACCALVPIDLALNGADIVEHGLDLDYQQRARSSIECQKIDPSTPPSIDDRDFPGGLEAGGSKATVDMA